MKKRKILIVDDDADLAKSLKVALEETGDYEVTFEAKSKNALESAKRFQPDFIFLDIMMPGMCGTEVAHQLSQHEDLKKVPIAYLTAMVTQPEVAERSGMISGYAFVAKPVNLTELVDCIEKHFQQP